MTMHVKIWMRRSQNMLVWLSPQESFGPAVLHNLLRLAKGTHSKALHLPEKSVANIM